MSVPTNVRPRASRFVGRELELDTLATAIDEGARVLVLLAPPGFGKTRLALEHAVRALHDERWAGGVWRCELGEAGDAAGLCLAVARAIGLPLTVDGARDVGAQVGQALAARGPMLLVLDSLERVPGGADVVEQWREAAPQVALLITSREQPRLVGARTLEIEPLPTEDAIALYLDRTAAPEFWPPPTGTEIDAVGSLVHALEGIPLAIELCSARARILSPAQILQEMSHRLDLLVAGPTPGRPRGDVVRAALEESWARLDDAQQAALARCSLFRGGFDLAGFAAVCAPPDHGRVDVLDLVQALHDRSWILAETGPAGTRYRLYDVVRDFAAEQLAVRDEPGSEERHAVHTLRVTEPEAVRAAGLEAPAALATLLLEEENLATVATRCAARHPERAARACIVLRVLLQRVGPLGKLADLVERVLAGAAGRLEAALHARLLLAGVRSRLYGGDPCRAEALAGEAVRRAEEVGAWTLVIEAELDRAMVHRFTGRRGGEARCVARAADLLERFPDGRLQGLWHVRRARTLGAQGRLAEAVRECATAVVHLEAQGDLDSCAIARSLLGNLHLQRGEPEEAIRCYREGERVFEAGLNLANAVSCRAHTGTALAELGRLDEARVALERALEDHRPLGSSVHEGYHHYYLGNVELEAGALDAAEGRYRRAVALLSEGGDPEVLSLARLGLAAVAAQRGCGEQAAAVVGGTDERASPKVTMVAELVRGLCEASLARRALERGDRMGARRSARAARAHFEHVAEAGKAPGLDVLQHDEVRAAARILGRALEAVEPSSAPPSGPLRLAADGSWLEVGGPRQSLGKRPALRAILAALARRRVETPGLPLSIDDLFEAGWPRARATAESRRNRVQVAVARLRQLGIGPTIQRWERGFRIDPQAALALD